MRGCSTDPRCNQGRTIRHAVHARTVAPFKLPVPIAPDAVGVDHDISHRHTWIPQSLTRYTAYVWRRVDVLTLNAEVAYFAVLKEDCMKITRQIIVFDAADLAAESTFWASLLGGTVQADDDWHSVSVDGEWRLGVQLAPNHVPPNWPDGTPEQQIHLDLWVEDLNAAHEEAISLGARLLKPAGDLNAAQGFQVYCRYSQPGVRSAHTSRLAPSK